MFSKFFVVVPFVLGLTLQASAHAIISPALGVTGTPVRNDVQRPSKQAPCGTVDIAQTINTTTPIVAAADGSFATNITNFNAGQDGSRQVTAEVDATGTGSSFVAATVTKNGDLAPTDVGSQQIAVQLPPGTTCSGGAGSDLCLVSFTTAGGFGNCVVVQQGAAAVNGTAAANSTATAATAADSTVATAGNTTTAATGAKHHHKGGKKAKAAAAAAAAAPVDARAFGTRAARAFRRAMEEWM